MRKITRETVTAFLAGKSRTVGSTSTDGTILTLHGNVIARRNPETGTVHATLAGWPTVTTRERLNGLAELLGLGRPFYQKSGQQYWNDHPIESTATVQLVVPVVTEAV